MLDGSLDTPSDIVNPFVGDFLSFLASALFAIVLGLAPIVRKILPLFVYTIWQLAGGTIVIILYSLVAEGTTLAGSDHLSLFGWTRPDLVRGVAYAYACAP